MDVCVFFSCNYRALHCLRVITSSKWLQMRVLMDKQANWGSENTLWSVGGGEGVGDRGGGVVGAEPPGGGGGALCLWLIRRLRMAVWLFFSTRTEKGGSKFYIPIPNHANWGYNSKFSPKIMKNWGLKSQNFLNVRKSRILLSIRLYFILSHFILSHNY